MEQRPRFLHRSRLPQAAGGCAERDAGRVPAGAAGGAAGGAAHACRRARSRRSTWPRPRSAPAWPCSRATRRCWRRTITPMSVREALRIINAELDEYLARQEGDYDCWTRFALTWFQQHGFDTGPYGEAEMLAKARDVAVQGVVEAGILEAKGGKVAAAQARRAAGRLRARSGPTARRSGRACQHLIKRLEGERRGRRPRGSPSSSATRPTWRAISPIASIRSASATSGPRRPAPTTAW